MIYVFGKKRDEVGFWLREFGTSDLWDDPELRIVLLSNHRDFYRIHGYRWQEGDEFLVVGDILRSDRPEIEYRARFIGVPEDILDRELKANLG